jgi:CrcB protein
VGDVSAAGWIGLALLGGCGAVGRFLLDGAISRRLGRGFPSGTLAVNLTGAFVFGIVGAALHGDAEAIVGTGLIGAYTTFSTWMFETQRLAEDRRDRAAVANLGVSLVAGVLLAWAGTRIGTHL